MDRAIVAACLCLTAGVVSAGAQQGQAPPAPTERTAPSFGGIFTGTLRAFMRVPSKTNLVWLAGGGGAALSLMPADQEVSDALQKSEGARRFFVAGNIAGNTLIPVGAGFTVYGIGRATGNARAALFGSDLVCAQFVSGIMTQAIKIAARRQRPDASRRASFPSGHTATMFATATVVQRDVGWKWSMPVYAAAVYVGLSRIQTQKHYPSDVAFGAVIGIVSARAAAFVPRRAKPAITPFAAPGIVGVWILW